MPGPPLLAILAVGLLSYLNPETLLEAVGGVALCVAAGIIFADAVLFVAALAEGDLRGFDLAGAVLAGADLAGALLDGADLTGADLTDADLEGTSLVGAVMPDGTVAP